MICIVEGCPRPVLAHSHCNRHYQQIHKHGVVSDEIPFLDSFWSRVAIDENGCWEWTGATAGNYGQVKVLEHAFPAHRVAYRLYVGEIPSTALVCHKCDNRLCIRPDHLFLGTAEDNMQDMVRKGRHPKQLASYRTKLNAAKVEQIRQSQASTKELARQYGVDTSTIRDARTGLTWKQAEPPHSSKDYL